MTSLTAIDTSPGAQIGAETDHLPAKTVFFEEVSMPPVPQIPSHLRFMIANIQERAMDLALLGHTGARTELDIGDTYAVFELTTRPGHLWGDRKQRQRLTAELHGVVNPSITRQPLDEALTEARTALAAMLDHLNALIDQEMPA